MKQLKRLKTPVKRLFSTRKRKVIAVVALFLVGQLAFDLWAYQAYRDYGVRNDNDRLVMMMTNVIHDATKPAVIDPSSHKVYLPDADLVLPPYPENITEVRYAFDTSTDRPHPLQVTTAAAIQSGSAKLLSMSPGDKPSQLFGQVPNAQACARGVLVTLKKPGLSTDDSLLVFSKKLHDGREMRVYEQYSCSGYNFTPLIEYLKQADSYKS